MKPQFFHGQILQRRDILNRLKKTVIRTGGIHTPISTEAGPGAGKTRRRIIFPADTKAGNRRTGFLPRSRITRWRRCRLESERYMCGRVYMAPANPELREIVKEMNRSALSERFRKEKKVFQDEKEEVCPSSILPVIATNRAGRVSVFPMKWGFSLPGKLVINARIETASEKPLFREAWRGHRCVIPVSGYYEWEHDWEKRPGQKYMLHRDDSGLIRLAGLYRMENGLPAFVVLTRPAAESLRWMHDRMPLILTKDSAEAWICPQADPETLTGNCLTDITWRKSG